MLPQGVVTKYPTSVLWTIATGSPLGEISPRGSKYRVMVVAWPVVVVGFAAVVVGDIEDDEIEFRGVVVEEVPTGEHASTVSSSTTNRGRVDTAPDSCTVRERGCVLSPPCLGP